MEYMERKRWVFFGLPFTFTKYYIKEEAELAKNDIYRAE